MSDVSADKVLCVVLRTFFIPQVEELNVEDEQLQIPHTASQDGSGKQACNVCATMKPLACGITQSLHIMLFGRYTFECFCMNLQLH